MSGEPPVTSANSGSASASKSSAVSHQQPSSSPQPHRKIAQNRRVATSHSNHLVLRNAANNHHSLPIIDLSSDSDAEDSGVTRSSRRDADGDVEMVHTSAPSRSSLQVNEESCFRWELRLRVLILGIHRNSSPRTLYLVRPPKWTKLPV